MPFMDDYERDTLTRFFQGELPPGFELDFCNLKKLQKDVGVGKARLGPELLAVLIWTGYKEYWPHVHGEAETKRLAPAPALTDQTDDENPPVIIAPRIEDTPPQVDDVDKGSATWETVKEGRRVAVFYDFTGAGAEPKLAFGRYQGRHGVKKAKVAFNGDTKGYRLVDRAEVDLNPGSG